MNRKIQKLLLNPTTNLIDLPVDLPSFAKCSHLPSECLFKKWCKNLKINHVNWQIIILQSPT